MPNEIERAAQVRQQYQTLTESVGLIDRDSRSTLVVEGADRVTWLNNLVTQNLTTLAPGKALLAFFLNVQGRILFDAHILVREDALWLDLPRDASESAAAHLDRYHIMEDVRCTLRDEEIHRVALVGPLAAESAAELGAVASVSVSPSDSAGLGDSIPPKTIGAADVGAMTIGRFTDLGEAACWFRHGLLGEPAVEILASSEVWPELDRRLDGLSCPPGSISPEALDVRRIEAGLPSFRSELNEEALPAECDLFEHAVAAGKGCYLGQEIVERMRTRGAVARRLVPLHLEGSTPLAPGSPLQLDGQRVGVLTSTCKRIVADEIIGLGYVRSGYAQIGQRFEVLGADEAAGTATVTAVIGGPPVPPRT
jgi:folate-binding protein YgfZ